MQFSLPRDLHNFIVKKLDLETRRNLGIICKIRKTPEFIKFQETLTNIVLSKTIHQYGVTVNGFVDTQYSIDIGSHVCKKNTKLPLYSICRDINKNKVMYYVIYYGDVTPQLYTTH
jgi:hypothetical protein